MRFSRALTVSVIAVVLSTFGVSASGAPMANNDPLAGAEGLGDPYYPQDGNGGYDAAHYDVSIFYDPPSKQMTGAATMTATATQLLRSFNMDFNGPPVRKVTVNGAPATFTRYDAHELAIVPAMPLFPLIPFTVTVEYAGPQRDHVSHNGEPFDGGWLFTTTGGAFAAGEPHSATTWDPLNDTPRDKATFTLHATVPNGWEVVSIGRRLSDVPAGPQQHTVTWDEPHPTIGYLTTVAIDKFSYLYQNRANGMPIISAFAPSQNGKRKFEQRLPEVLDFLEQLYGPYPFDAAGGIHIDAKVRFSLEIQTRPIYAPKSGMNTFVHENAHQWWGDSMSVWSWSDICLNECFASYTADILWPERREGKDADQIYREALAEAAKDPEFWSVPLFNPGRDREFTSVYSRGPLFLHALRRTMGDPAFFSGIGEFVQMHRYGHATIGEFRQFMQVRTPVNLTPLLDAWLNAPVKPAPEFIYPGTLRR